MDSKNKNKSKVKHASLILKESIDSGTTHSEPL